MPDLPPDRRLPLLRFLPNSVTIGALCAGLTAMRFAIEGKLAEAVLLIVVAALLDGLDGRLARLLKSESDIGAELDSLVDFVNFGVAPALVMYIWAFEGQGGMSWLPVLIYAVCCVLRLARFNVGSRTEGDTREYKHFRGIPSPAGALMGMLPLYVAFMLPSLPHLAAPLIGLYMVLIGGLMISRVPTPSFKSVKVKASHARLITLGFIAIAASISFFPWATLVALCLGYSVVLVVTMRRLARGHPQEHQD